MTVERIRRAVLLLLIPLLIVISIVYLANVSKETEAGIQASGTVEALEVTISPEVAGRIDVVLVDEGDHVEVGDLLLRLDDELLQAQREQTQAAVQTAKATLNSAQINLDLLTLQADLTRRMQRQTDQPNREDRWRTTMPSEFDLPVWYFDQSEEIDAAQKEVDLAQAALQDEQSRFDTLLEASTMEDLQQAADRLADARISFRVAKEVLDRARRARDDADLEQYAQDRYDAAKAELEAAQSDYDQLLSGKDAEDVLEARARLAVAQERYDSARDHLAALQSGDYALQVRIAERNLDQAQAAVDQANAGLSQAQAELDVIDLQLGKMEVSAPISGVVITRNVEPGEVLQPGAVALTLAQLDDLTITVFIEEDRYGQIHLGQAAIVTVDSFPDETFNATVTRIADRAEFTPRNVQTKEGRRVTVFAIKLELNDPTGRLKPGMPADVEFVE
ncbi:MAG: efflux RND transporter periplasmic adaptor subunit [Anaerolineales bacterium]